jgi:hypothetical protein
VFDLIGLSFSPEIELVSAFLKYKAADLQCAKDVKKGVFFHE